MYNVLNTISEYTDFYILKKHYFIHFLACFQNRRKASVYPEMTLKGIYDKVKSCFSKFVIVMVNICLIWEAAVKKVAAGYLQNKCR